MTVLIYVNTSKQVGDAEHLKVFAKSTPRKNGSRKMTPKALLSNMRCWSEASQAGARLSLIRIPVLQFALSRPRLLMFNR